MKMLTPIYSLAIFALSSLPAWAKTCLDQAGNVIPCSGGTVPEPGALALLAIGAGAAAIVWARKRNKK